MEYKVGFIQNLYLDKILTHVIKWEKKYFFRKIVWQLKCGIIDRIKHVKLPGSIFKKLFT